MARFSGWTPQTAYRAVVGPGVAVANINEALLTPAGPMNDAAVKAVLDSGAVLGATDDGLEFTLDPEYQEWAFAGVPGNIRGGRRLTNVTVQIAGSFTEIVAANMERFVPFVDASVWQTTEATPTSLGNKLIPRSYVVDADYLSNLAIFAERQGTTVPFVAVIYNAFNAEGFTLGLAGDEDRSAADVTFTGSYGVQTFDETTGRFNIPCTIYEPTPAVLAP